MHLPAANYLVIVVTGVILFMLGGLWYSPALFANPWMAAMGKNREDMMKAAEGQMGIMYGGAVVSSLLVSYVMWIVVNHFEPWSALRGAEVGFLCWLGFAGATSHATASFSMSSKTLWLINSGYNLAQFVIAGVIISVWR